MSVIEETETGWGPLFLERTSRKVWRHDQGLRAIALTPLSFDLLWFFTEHPRVALTRPQIYRAVWGADLSDRSNTLTTMVAGLRTKLGEPNLIHTVRGIGFKLDVRR